MTILIKTWLHDNWGDKINGELVKLITGVEPKTFRGDAVLEEDNYLIVGSIIHFTDHHSIVWGAGILDEGTDFKNFRPKKVCAVRGQKSRGHLLKYGIPCPEVYGDPALLFPRYYKPEIKKRYKLGIVLHWQDKVEIPFREDVVGVRHDAGIYEYITLINSCEKIASSSLHGIICADSYSIPAIRLKFWGSPSDFKFEDYFQSVERPLKEPLQLDGIDVDRILKSFYSYKMKIPDLDRLMEKCPFKV